MPSGEVRVLDCYGGDGKIWSEIERRTGRTIRRLSIDVKKDPKKMRLFGDNLKYLPTLDLSRFNVIDLDAYGVPTKQLEILFSRGFSGVVYVTYIPGALGNVCHNLLRDIGFTTPMIKKYPTIFGRRTWEYFKQWLALKGVTEIEYYLFSRKDYGLKMDKHYLCLWLNGAA